MKRKHKVYSISLIVVVGLGLFYFLSKNYTNSKYVDRLPEIPDVSEASMSFQKYISKVNTKTINKPSARNIGALGMVYHANDYFDQAEVCYLLATERNPEKWIWSYYLGCIKRELGDSENAIKYFNDVLEIQPNQFMARYYLAEAYRQIGEDAKFEALLQGLSEMSDQHFFLENTERTSYFLLPVYASLELAKLYIANGKLELAEKKLKTLISRNISFGPAYRQLSIIYAEEGDKELSKYYSDRSKDLEDYTPPPDVLIDRLSYHSRSETYLLKQVEDAIRSSNLYWALDLVNLSLKHLLESKYVLSKAIRLFISMNIGRKATPYLDKHLEAFQDDYKELVDVGIGLSNSGLKSEAKKYFLAATKFKNKPPETKSRLAGMFFDRLDMEDKALELMDELLEQHPNNPDVIGGATFLSIKKDDMANAKKYLSRLKILEPKNPRINIFNGILAKNAGDTEKAILFYEKAFKEVPDQVFIIEYLTDYYKKNKKWSKLSDLYETALEASPNDPYLQEGYGSLLINCPNKSIQNPKLAKEFSERALINFKSDALLQIAAGHSLAKSYFQLNKRDEALFYIQKTLENAKLAQFSREDIAEIERTSRAFQNIINSEK